MAVPERYRAAIETAAWNIVKRWHGTLEIEDMTSEAYILAEDRWRAWEAKERPEGYAVTDLTFRLSNRVQAILRSQGWQRIQGKWQPVAVDRQFLESTNENGEISGNSIDYLSYKRWLEETDDDGPVVEPSCAYEPVTRRQRADFLAILAQFHPKAYAAARDLVRQKPATMSWPTYRKRQAVRQAKFHRDHLPALLDAYLGATKGRDGSRDDMSDLLMAAMFSAAA